MIGPLGGAAVGWGLGRSRRRATPWWYVAGQTCVAAYQPIGAASLAASYVNLANPGTYDAAPGVAPTFDAATGWTFDGTKWLNTNIIVTLSYTIIARFSDLNLIKNNYIMGAANSAVNNAFAINQGNNGRRMWWRGSTILRDGSATTSGVQALAGQSAYMDGTFIATLADAGSAPDRTLHIGSYFEASGAATCGIQAVAIYSTTFGSSEVAALTARMQAL